MARAVVLGELALDGRTLPCRGVLPATLASRAAAVDVVLVPRDNVGEGRLVPGVDVRGASSLPDAVRVLSSPGAQPSGMAATYTPSLVP